MESDDTVSGEFQRSTRMPLDAVVRLHFQGTVAYQNGFAANVSATGMFVKHPAPPPLGTQLVFEFNLGAERKPVQGAGEVVWVRDKYLGPGQPAGVGIRFLQLDTQSRDHIAEALFEYLEQSLTEDSLLDSSGYSFSTEPASSEDPTISAPGRSALPEEGLQQLEPIDDIYGAAPYGSAAVPHEPQPGEGESFDFAQLERLPPPAVQSPARSTAPVAADSKRTFSVFTPLDEADRETADIVREALRDEAPLPMMAAAAARSSERESSRTWVWLLLAALFLGGGYLAWTQWGAAWFAGRAAETPVQAASPAPAPAPPPVEPLPATSAPGTTLAETVGVDPNSTSPAAAPPHGLPATAPPEEAATDEPSDVAVAAQERAEAGTPSDTPTAPTENAPRPPAAAPTAPPQAAAAAPATPAANTVRAERLTGIAWRESGNGGRETALELTSDGAFATGTYSYSEIGGENPRVLIKLKGMQAPYRGPAPRAPQSGGALVRGVRTGFHVTAGGNEIHVVVDLARAGTKVLSLSPSADGLDLTLVLAP